MRRPAVVAVVLSVTGGIACSEPGESELGPPVVLLSSITLDSVARLGQFRLLASDPDGPVHLGCAGAFPGEGIDSLVLARPYAELRFAGDFLTTVCEATEGDSTVGVHASIPDEYAIDRLPDVALPLPSSTIHVGDPSVWPLRVSDDWGVAEYWFSIAPEPNCTQHWTRVGTWPGAGRTAIDTTVTATFAATGPHCVVLGARDDLGRNVGTLIEVEVAP